ncbi:MAG: nuclear transport factor 2 family protein [Gemmatimonadales bacterium]|jgi:hypothetical protein|nr:nuclear transport factor 2 family protein [Gemmatimonadales bacterium]
MRRTFGGLILLLAAAALPARAQTAADSAGIREAALNYIEGWYAGNAERMTLALHPDLAKRIVQPRPDGRTLENMTAAQLIDYTGRGGGRMTPAERQLKDVTILDIYRNVASVKIVAGDWIDYLHVARFDDGWKIVNVLWEMKPRG